MNGWMEGRHGLELDDLVVELQGLLTLAYHLQHVACLHPGHEGCLLTNVP